MTPVSLPVSNCSLMAAEPRSNRKGGDFFGGIARKARATTLTSKGDGMNVEFLRRLYLQEGETNMNSLKDNVAVVTDAMYVIVGASGNTGSIIANTLLLKGEKVRVMGRDAGRLQRFVRKGGEAVTANVSDAAALTKAFSGARAAYLMLPPVKSREDQERQSDAMAKAVKEAGLPYAVHWSSYCAQIPEGAAPIAG